MASESPWVIPEVKTHQDLSKVWSTSLCTTSAKAWFLLLQHIGWICFCWGATVWSTQWNLYLDNGWCCCCCCCHSSCCPRCFGTSLYCLVSVWHHCSGGVNQSYNEGFNLIKDIGVTKDDKDVYEMAKWLAQHTVADGCVNLSTVAIKHLQGLVYCVKITLCINSTLQQLISPLNRWTEQWVIWFIGKNFKAYLFNTPCFTWMEAFGRSHRGGMWCMLGMGCIVQWARWAQQMHGISQEIIGSVILQIWAIRKCEQYGWFFCPWWMKKQRLGSRVIGIVCCM